MRAGTHIAGDVGQELLERIRGIPLECCLAASVDVAKPSWRLLVSNFLGQVVVGGTTIIADEPGYAELRGRLEDAARAAQAGFVRVGVEAAGHYHETLAGRLLADGYDLVCHGPAAVKRARAEAGKARLKTDDLDAAAMCSLT